MPDNFFAYLNTTTQGGRYGADNLVRDFFLSYDLKINLGDKLETGTGGV